MIDDIKKWKDFVGSFVNADYSTPKGVMTARGVLVSVSDQGGVVVRHLLVDGVCWVFNVDCVVSCSFSPVKTVS